MTSSRDNKFSANETLNSAINEFFSEIEQKEEAKNKYQKIVQAGIAKWISEFQKGNIQMNTVDDLKKLIEIDLVLKKR